MNGLRRAAALATVLATSILLTTGISAAGAQKDDKNTKDSDGKPKVSLKAQPVIAMSPARVVLTAELTGGANDFEEFYCPSVEWDWGDDTRSEKSDDCA